MGTVAVGSKSGSIKIAREGQLQIKGCDRAQTTYLLSVNWVLSLCEGKTVGGQFSLFYSVLFQSIKKYNLSFLFSDFCSEFLTDYNKSKTESKNWHIDLLQDLVYL